MWGNSKNVFDKVIKEDISLCFTSPPYLFIDRAYGTHTDEEDYINFIVDILEPIRERMVDGAN